MWLEHGCGLGVANSTPNLQPCHPVGRHIWLLWGQYFCFCKPGVQSPGEEGSVHVRGGRGICGGRGRGTL